MPKGQLPVVSYLAVPVISQSGEVHGGLFFGHDKPAAFGKEAEEVVKAVATHAASAIDNARLLQAARREIAERRREEERHRRRTEALMKESEARLQEALAAKFSRRTLANPAGGAPEQGHVVSIDCLVSDHI